MQTLVSDTDRIVVAGANTIRFSARVPREVPAHLVNACLEAGVMSVDKPKGTPRLSDQKPKKRPKPKLRHEEVAEAIRDIINREDNDDALTADGLVRTDAISEIVGYNVTATQRDEAQKLIDSGEV